MERLSRIYPEYRFNVDLLRKIYKLAGVAYTKMEKVPWKSMHKSGLDDERRAFATKLA